MRLFTYGTLQSLDLMAAVAGEGVTQSIGAVLAGFDVLPVPDTVIPCIVAAKGEANGVLWSGLSVDQLNRISLYEGAFGYELRDISVQTEAGAVAAQCYFPPTDMRVGGETWNFAEWRAHHLAPAVLAAREVFASDPLPTPVALRQMWPMIEARAWTKHRVRGAPADLRYDPAPSDFMITEANPSAGVFYRFQDFDVTHKRFDGLSSPSLRREAFIGVDAALVLPYDPIRDKVLLVEQFRIGPSARHDPNPWMLEPIAGIIDARETPEDAAARESIEEAGISLRHLEKAGQFYPSPGATTDFFYSFVGLCDLPQDQSYQGGLPKENEDLRLHPISFKELLALVESDEICVGPLIQLTYWLAFHRDRLRAMA